MINTIEQFGRNAGKVWNVLSDNNKLTENELIELTSLREYELYIAIGWLAKEDKIKKEGDYFKLEKTNLIEHTGKNAGILWNFLSKEGNIDINRLLNKLKIDEKDIFSAIDQNLRF